MSSRPLPLAGVRVIEIAEVWAGPMGCTILGDLGADVIKVESYPRPTITRPAQVGPNARAFANNDLSGRFYDRYAIHNIANRNKRGIAVNLRRPEGAAILKRLVAGADAYVEGYSAGTIDKMGLGYEVMRQVNPQIVMLSMAGWGQKGPYKSFVTLGNGIDAASGHHMLRGYRHDPPINTQAIVHSDSIAACFAAFTVMAAVRYRRRTGKGQYIDLAQAEGLFGQLARPFLQAQLTGIAPECGGNDHPDYVFQGCYPVRGEDAWIAISVRDERDWREIRELIPGLQSVEMPVPSGWVGPRDDLEAIDGIVAGWTRDQDAEPLCELLRSRGIPAMPVHDEEETFNDPNFQARGFFERVYHAEAGERTVVGPMFHFLGTPLHTARASNLYGEHNHEVLQELGYTADEIAEFERTGVIGDRLPPPGATTPPSPAERSVTA